MVELSPEVLALTRVALFQGVDVNRLRLLVFLGQEQFFRDGELIVVDGDTSDCCYVILEGEALIQTGKEIDSPVIAHIADGGVFGEMAMLIEEPRSASVRAKGELRVLRVEREAMLELMQEFPQMAIEMSRSLAKRLKTTTQELQKQISQNAELGGNRLTE